MGRVNKPYKGVGQGKFGEFISFWVPGAIKHIDSSAWGHLAAILEAFRDEVPGSFMLML